MISIYEKRLATLERKHAYHTYDVELTPLTHAGKVLFGRLDLLKEVSDSQIRSWWKDALKRNKQNFKPNHEHSFFYDDPKESEKQRVNEVLKSVQNMIYVKWETSTKYSKLESPVQGVDYSVKIEKRVDILDAPKKSGKQKALNNPAIEVEGTEVTETSLIEG